MSDRNERLLAESVEHWQLMRDDPDCGERPGSRDCPCCREAARGGWRCPIADAGYDCCDNTPCGAAADAYWVWWRRRATAEAPALWLAWQAEADKEIAFLDELLVAERAKRKAGEA